MPGFSNNSDLQLNMIDTNTASGTFNTIIQTINAGLQTQACDVVSFAATPDGKYVYMNYDDCSGTGMLAIFDIVHGGPATTLTMSSLGAADTQYNLQVSPDGRSLLLQAYYANFFGYNIMVFDIGANPLSPTAGDNYRECPGLWSALPEFISSGRQPALCSGFQFRIGIGI